METPPADWLKTRLLTMLSNRQADTLKVRSYYAGKADPPTISARYAEAYQNLLGVAYTPWSRLIVDTISERIQFIGVFSGVNEETDAQLWDGFRASYMDADQAQVHAEALVTGTSYVSVWPYEDGVRIAAESSEEVIHISSPGNPRVIEAALKVYPDDVYGVWRAEIYTPDRLYRYISGDDKTLTPAEQELQTTMDTQTFMLEGEEPNPFGVVPIVPFINRSRGVGEPFSELTDLLPVIDRINKVTLDMLLSSEVAGFRQRWATGIEIPRDPETGKPVEAFNAAVSKLWISESPDTTFGSFDTTDLSPYMKVIGDSVGALSSISRVPSHYLHMNELANPPSADSMVAAEAGLVAKVYDRMTQFGQSWERVASLYAIAAKLTGEIKPEIAWANPEHRSPAVVADALVKLNAIGIPSEALWTEWGATPEQISNWRRAKAEEATRAAIAAAAGLPQQLEPTPAPDVAP